MRPSYEKFKLFLILSWTPTTNSMITQDFRTNGSPPTLRYIDIPPPKACSDRWVDNRAKDPGVRMSRSVSDLNTFCHVPEDWKCDDRSVWDETTFEIRTVDFFY